MADKGGTKLNARNEIKGDYYARKKDRAVW
jgi:hypothetical protein